MEEKNADDLKKKKMQYWIKEHKNKQYQCKYCGHLFDASKSFVCPRCLRTN